MTTWQDLDSESGSEKEEAEEEANVAVGLVATVTSEAEPDSDSEDENEICLRAKEKHKPRYLDSGRSRHMTGEKYVPHPRNEGRRKCEVWRQPIWQDHWYRNYW